MLGKQNNHGIIKDVSRSAGTLQKDWTIVNSFELTDAFCIAVVGHEGWNNDPFAEVPYSLVVSFEAIQADIPIYTLMVEAQIETGTPYILFKDAANRKSNQKNLGTIKSSNLCTEIIEYTSKTEQAVCNLASIAVNQFITLGKRSGKLRKHTAEYDHQALYDVAYQTTFNLNKVIDVNYYPTPETLNSNLTHRPIGIGIQGLADAFAIMGYEFGGEDSKKLNEEIFETIYYAAMEASIDLAKREDRYHIAFLFVRIVKIQKVKLLFYLIQLKRNLLNE
jgi:hypothetical protein